jgi:arginyl-tRNA synthetase
MDFFPFQEFKKEAEVLLQRVFNELKIQAKPILEIPPLGIADLAFPAYSLEPLAKEKQIKDISSLLCEKSKELLAELRSKWIKAIEKKGEYLNFYIDQDQLTRKTLKEVASAKSTYGNLSPKKKTILLEHTSANPSGPLHVGRARNPIIGDTLARILPAAGYKVETQFYVDDVGKQVAILTWGVKNLAEESLPPCTRQKRDHKLVRYYQKANELMQSNKSVAEEINGLVRAFEGGEERAQAEAKQVYQEALTGIIESLDRINVKFDSFVNESSMIKIGLTQKVVEGLKQSKCANHEELAWYLDLKEFGIKGEDATFYFTRGDGTSLYATRDIAYHLWKADRADRLLNVLGEDHKLEAKQVEIALDLLRVKQKPRSIFYAFVSLPEGRMSTRKGRVVYLDDLIDEAIALAYQEVKKRRGAELTEEQLKKVAKWVGIGAIRYNIIKVQPEKAIKFKWEDALSFEGNAAPFIQYAHARCSSILKKARKETEAKRVNYSLLSHPCEIALVKHIAKFPELIKSIAESYKPNLLANYAYELATLFNQFYRDCRVIGSGKFEGSRLVLVKVVAQTLKNSLNLLGISAPEYM